MRRAVCLLTILSSATAGVAASIWPPLSGDLSGKFQLTDGSDLPAIAWRVQVPESRDGALRAELTANAPGLAVRVALVPPHDGGPGSWQIREATIALADWWQRAAERAGVPVQPADLRVGGTLHVTGEGAWSEAEWGGVVRVEVTEGSAGSDEQHWSAEALGLAAEFSFQKKELALRTAELRVGSAQAAGVAAHNLVLAVAGASQHRLEVRRAQLDAFGGRLTLTPFTLDPAAPVVKTAADFSEIALGELAALVPHAIAEARGQIAGQFSLSCSLKPSVQPDAGGLEITHGASATFRLAPSPGLLTGHAPPRIAFLPSWTGRLRDWFSVDNPAYDTLRRIELGQIPLAMDDLRVQLYPDGPDGARTAHVEVTARPTAGGVVERVTFSVNVSGPLEQVLRLGMNQRAKLHVAPAH